MAARSRHLQSLAEGVRAAMIGRAIGVREARLPGTLTRRVDAFVVQALARATIRRNLTESAKSQTGIRAFLGNAITGTAVCRARASVTFRAKRTYPEYRTDVN